MRFAVRELARRGVPALVANSFSKNFSLYGERCGGLHVICENADAAAPRARPIDRSGALELQQSADARREDRRAGADYARRSGRRGKRELAAMCERIARMRVAIHDGLRDHVSRRSAVALREAARHVHVHGAVGGAGRPAARGVRRVHPALGTDVRRGAERDERRAGRRGVRKVLAGQESR